MYYFQQIFTSILLDQILVLKREFSERYLILREIRMPIPHIDSYQFGKIVIDGVTHTKDVILLPTKTIHNWWRTEGHFLDISDTAVSRHMVLHHATFSAATGRVYDSW